MVGFIMWVERRLPVDQDFLKLAFFTFDPNLNPLTRPAVEFSFRTVCKKKIIIIFQEIAILAAAHILRQVLPVT